MLDVVEQPAPSASLRSPWDNHLTRALVAAVAAAIVAYFTGSAAAIDATKTQIAVVKATEESHFQELLRTVQELRADVRELAKDRGR